MEMLSLLFGGELWSVNCEYFLANYQELSQTLNSQKTPHISSLWVSYGVYSMTILWQICWVIWKLILYNRVHVNDPSSVPHIHCISGTPSDQHPHGSHHRDIRHTAKSMDDENATLQLWCSCQQAPRIINSELVCKSNMKLRVSLLVSNW